MRSLNILVVDDDAPTCLVISTVLTRQGHTVEIANDGKEAISLFTNKPECFDVIITDHRMPLVSGLELVHYLRKNEFGGKIIVISGLLTPELLTEYRSKRVDKILQKTFSVSELSSMLSETFKTWQSDGESFIAGIPSPSPL